MPLRQTLRVKTKASNEPPKPPVFVWKDGGFFDETQQHEYPIPAWSFDFVCRDLSIRHVADNGSGEDSNLRELRAYVAGRAELDGSKISGSSVREMSDPDNETRRFKLTIQQAREEELKPVPLPRRFFRKDKTADASYKDLVRRVREQGGITAYIGFHGPIDELNLDPMGWFLYASLPAATFSHLLTAIRENRAHDVTVQVHFANLFARVPYHHAMGSKLFLPSSEFESQRITSDEGLGYVCGVSWREAPKAPEPDHDDTPTVPPVDPLVQYRAERMRVLGLIETNLRWIAYVAGAALAFFVFRTWR